MSPSFMEKMFDPFEREKNSTLSGVQGTGLGLAIALGVARAHGGTISVRSQPGEGSEFTLGLPAGPASQFVVES